MKRLDQGLGALGLLSLTAALALLLTIGIPITVSKDRVELKDWLGFAGNVVGAFVTLLAAVIAWYAVQRQIGVQREANLLSVMTREETRLENDLHAFEVCIALLATAHSAKVVYDAGGSYTELDKYVRELTSMGLSSDPIEMRRFIQTKVNSEMSPHLCTEVTSACANVMLAADLLQSLQSGEQVWVVARDSLISHQKALETCLRSLSEEQLEINERLRRFRARIEAALGALDLS